MSTKKHYFTTLLLAAICIAIFIACGTDNSDTEDTDDSTDTGEVTEQDTTTDDTEAPDDEVSVEDLTYDGADATSSKESGEIAMNFIFYDDQGNKRALAEFHEGKELIWLMFGSYSCPYCMDELELFPDVYLPKYTDQGFEIIAVIAGGSNEPTNIQNKKEQITYAHGEQGEYVWGYFGSSATAQKVLTTYSTSGAVPINVLIDADTMEIVQYFQGNLINPNTEESRIEYWLGKLAD